MKLAPIAVLLLTCALSGCASAPAYEEIADRIPPVPVHCGRIYFYRPSLLGTHLRPSVSLNGEVVGESVAGGFFFVDEAAGDYEVGVFSGREPKWRLRLDEGQTRYVEISITVEGFDAYPVARLVGPAVGEAALHELRFTGRISRAASPPVP